MLRRFLLFHQQPPIRAFAIMKTAAEYLENRVFEARRPRRDLQAVVALPDALAALEQALADADRYRYLLMRALRHHAADAAPRPNIVAAAEAIAEAKILPLHPGAEYRLAA